MGTSGIVVGEFAVKSRKRWMAVGYALEQLLTDN